MNWETLPGHMAEWVRGLELGDVYDILALGGPVVGLLVALSVVSLAVAIAKGVQFASSGVGRHRRAREAVAHYVRGDVEGARRLSAFGPVSAAVVHAAIEAADRQEAAAARDTAETMAFGRLHQLRRMIGLLDTTAQIAPLLGLFGTVLGMIDAFRALEGAGSAVDPSILAAGIWVALLTTAVGLAVAMPASVLAAWFDARVSNEEVALDGLIATLFNAAPAARPAHPAASVTPMGRAVHELSPGR